MSWGMSGMCGEIAEPLDEQIAGLRVLGVPRANLTKLRLTADGPALSIDELSDEQLAELRRRLDGSGIGCYCVTSPVAKYAVDTDEAKVERQLARSIEAANVLRSRWIRVFSFAPRDGSTGAEDRDAVKAAFERLVRRIETDGDGAVALLENNYRMYTLDGESTRDILSDYEPEQAALAFDAHAYVASETRPFDEAWGKVAPWVRVLHLKDYVAATGTIVPIGQGDGQWPQIMQAVDPDVVEDLALEPHLNNSAYGAGRDPLELFREARDVVLAMLDATGKPRPATNTT